MGTRARQGSNTLTLIAEIQQQTPGKEFDEQCERFIPILDARILREPHGSKRRFRLEKLQKTVKGWIALDRIPDEDEEDLCEDAIAA